MKHLIIYHFEDNDGVCSCALIKHHLLNFAPEDDEITLLPSNYASLAALMEEKGFEYFDAFDQVWMTDVSFNDWTYMKKLYDKFGKNFIWFDHHAPIIQESKSHGFDTAVGFRDTNRSAILCAYHYFHDDRDKKYNNGTAPTLLRLLSSWDSWSWVREGLDERFIRSFNTGVTSLSKLDVEYFMEYMPLLLLCGQHGEVKYPFDSNMEISVYMQRAIELGENIIDGQARANEALISGYGEFGWKVDGVENAVMVVTSGPSGSQMFKSVSGCLDHGIVFKHSKEGNWLVSLYNTRNDITFHCGNYLHEKYGGGGHSGAAGCTLTNEQFFKVISEKSL